MVNSTHMMSVVARSLVKTRVLAKSPRAILATIPARSFSAGLSGPRLALPPLMSQRDTQALQWPRRPHNSFAAHEMHGAQTMYATTILCVRKGDEVVVIGDGQVTQGSFVVKDNARKVRTLRDGKIISGFAGAAVDALALFDRLESKLEQYPELMRAAVELAKEWRSDKSLKRALNAVLVVADKDISLSISGNGDVLEPTNGVCGIGSGGIYAQCAAMALVDVPGMGAEEVARRSMKIASDTCIYTNHNYVIMSLNTKDADAKAEKKDP